MTENLDSKVTIDLLEKSLNGDKKAYKKFLLLISPYIKSRISKTIPQRYHEDALQEVLLAIHKSLKTIDTTKPIRPWINAIAHYKICDLLRLIYKDNKLEFEKIEALDHNHWDKIELKKQIEQLVRPLSHKETNILMLLKYEERSVKEVSKMLGLSESNVKIISFRAIRKLRENIASREFHE